VIRLGILFLFAAFPCAGALDLRGASVGLRPGASAIERKAAQVIQEEITKRTQLRLPRGEAGKPVIRIERRNAGPAEGFSLVTSAAGVTISGNDDRGVIFGAGYFLRQLTVGKQVLEIPEGLNVTSAPKVAIRGHQLGYRPKTNSYDGWDVPQWDQYIRELAIFGTNTIELIPPRSDDAPDSPHFPLAQRDMMVEMSRIAGEYGLEVSVWYPAMDPDNSNPKTVAAAVEEWAEVFRRLPRLDAIFVPGGDPGHTQPKYLMALLEKQAASLRRFHPKAQVWISPQSFDKSWYDEFIGILETQPAWLTGVVFGPQVRGSLQELRARVPKRYPIRFYPDITHSLRAEFPVPDWDFAYAATEGREPINPRPLGEAAIFRRYIGDTTGFVTYSEGCNDDVNKFVWSQLGWNPDADPAAIVRDYGRFVFGSDAFAEGVMALERNWQGPLAENAGVEETLRRFQVLEKAATPQQKLNWRFQQALYRAYYDAFLKKRLALETDQEARALAALRAGSTGEAVRILDTAVLTPEAAALRARVFELAEALFQSIRMQLSVPRYQAIGLERGANLDAIDFPLNNRVWIKKQIEANRTESVLHWTDPGPGGFYDDLGDPLRRPHLVPGLPFDQDPDFLKTPFTGFGGAMPQQGARISWFTHAETLGDTPLRMRYTALDRNAQYRARVIYSTDAPKIPIRLSANGLEIHGFREKPVPAEPLEFEIPRAATSSGELTLEWTKPTGGGGNGRGVQVCEVWLLRAP
jgi:hypothetical protein